MSPVSLLFSRRRLARAAIGAMRGINHSVDLALQSKEINDHITACMPIRFAAGITQGLRKPNGGRNHFVVTPVASPMVSLQLCNCTRISAGLHLKRLR